MTTSESDEITYNRVVRDLAQAHLAVDDGTSLIFLMPDPTFAEIRLLEVSSSAPTTRELFPFAFAARPDQGVPFPSVVLLVSPDEWDEIQEDRLNLPPGWVRKSLSKVAGR